MPDPEPNGAGDIQETEARIADALLPLTRTRTEPGRARGPAPYLRRHLVEHAAAGGILNGSTLTADFLPYADADRVRANHHAATGKELQEQLTAFTRVAHAWNWDDPEANRAMLDFERVALGGTAAEGNVRGWHTRWAHWDLSPSIVLGTSLTGHTGPVGAVATAMLPDGRAVAVTGS